MSVVSLYVSTVVVSVLSVCGLQAVINKNKNISKEISNMIVFLLRYDFITSSVSKYWY